MISHGGYIYDKKIEYDFSVNLNPLGMPDEIKQALIRHVDDFANYPDPKCSQLTSAAILRMYEKNSASTHTVAGQSYNLQNQKLVYESLSKETGNYVNCNALQRNISNKQDYLIKEYGNHIIFGNGAAELIYHIVGALRPNKALMVSPTFSEYERALIQVGCECEYYELSESHDFRLDARDFSQRISKDTDIVVLCNPNNPNGLLLSPEKVKFIADTCKENGCYLLLDECFIELCKHSPLSDCHFSYPNVITLRAFTKTYAMAGLRLGYCVINDEDLVKKINSARQPWSVSIPAQIAGITALSMSNEYLEKSRDLIARGRKYLSQELSCLGFKVFPSDANFILFFSDDSRLYSKLLEKGILIRDCSNFRGLKTGFYRICVSNSKCNMHLIRELVTIHG